jgi:hypothetical protein
MANKTSTMVGVVLATGAAFAVPQAADARPIPVAESYAELLKPLPNAIERLKLADAERTEAPLQVTPVQDHHHHHHHHHHSREWYRSHGYIWSGGAWILRPVHHHHHHHHHHED